MTAASGVDQRVLGAGTTVRFGLLLVLLLAAGAFVLSSGVRVVQPGYNAVSVGCALAGGVDPGGGWLAAVRSGRSMDTRTSAFAACLQRFAPAFPIWAYALGFLAVMVVAAGFFWGIPAWKARRGHVVELDGEVDVDGDLAPLLAELVAAAGLDRAPRFVMNPARATTNAVVFGRTGRPTVCLDGGLVARRKDDPAGFRAVVLHELAHIRNGDVTITYATVALWRAFLIAVLIPELALLAWELSAAAWPRPTTGGTDPAVIRNLVAIFGDAQRPVAIHELVRFAFLAILVYLTRADILRAREIYADRDAVAWGADPRHWRTGPATPARNAVRSFVELWRTHPRWDRRTRSLTDPAVLFGIQPLPTFLTGAATIIAGGQLSELFGTLFPGGGWQTGAASWLTALLVTAIIGIALWRAVAHAVLTGRRPPSGPLTGLWLGAGMAVGELMLTRTVGNQWFPSHPEVLLAHVLVAVVITSWTVQCARLWVRAWRGRTLRVVMLFGLAVPWLAFASWIGWWHEIGNQYVIGSVADFQQALREEYPAPDGGHSGAYAVIAPVYGILVALRASSLLPWVAAAMWLVPVLAWTVRPAPAVPGWVRRALPGVPDPSAPYEELPPLRTPLRGALLGALAALAAVVAAMAYLHSRQPPTAQLGGVYFLVYLSLMLLALGVAPVVAAVVTALTVRRYRLLLAMFASGVAALAAFAVTFLLSMMDGCLGPLNTLAHSCRWKPTTDWGQVAHAYWLTLGQVIMPSVLGPGIFLAATVVLLLQAVRRGVGRSRPASPGVPVRGRWIRRRVGLATISVAAVALTAGAILPGSQDSAAAPAPGQLAPALAGTSATPELRRVQLAAWLSLGGQDLIARPVVTDLRDLDIALHAPTIDSDRVDAPCADIGQVMRSANAYFPIPDPAEQPVWATVVGQLTRAAADCRTAARQVDSRLLDTALRELADVAPVAAALYQRLQAKVRR